MMFAVLFNAAEPYYFHHTQIKDGNEKINYSRIFE